MLFEISDQEDLELLAKWREEQIEKVAQRQAGTEHGKLAADLGVKIYTGAIGGLFSYTFTPTSIGTIVRVSNPLTNEHLDLYGDL